MAVASDDLLSEKAAAMRASLERSQAITDDVVSILGSFDHRLSALETAMRPTQVALSTQNRFFWIGSLLVFEKKKLFFIVILTVTSTFFDSSWLKLLLHRRICLRFLAISKIATKLWLQSRTETLFEVSATVVVAAFVCNFLKYQILWWKPLLQPRKKTLLVVLATAIVATFVCNFPQYQGLWTLFLA